MGEELILKKYSLRMKIIDKEQEAKPCLLVINNNAYNISRWQEFYKIVFFNNYYSDDQVSKKLIENDANKFSLNGKYQAILTGVESSGNCIKFSENHYVRNFFTDRNNLIALKYEKTAYKLKFELYLAIGNRGAFSAKKVKQLQKEAFLSATKDKKLNSKNPKYHLAHINGKILSSKEKFYGKISKEFDKKILIGDITISDSEHEILKQYMHYELSKLMDNHSYQIKYEKVFAFGLVHYAMKYYQKKAYWPFFEEEYNVKIPINNQHLVNVTFENIMKKYNKLYLKSEGKANYIQNIAMHSFICNKCADKFFDYIFEFWRIDLSRSIENISDGNGNDLFDILIDEIASNQYTSVQNIMLHTSMALKLNKRGCKHRVRRVLRMIDKSFFDGTDYSKSTNRISSLFEEWKRNPKSKYQIELKKTVSGTRRGRGEKLLSYPTLFFNPQSNSFVLKLPKEILKHCEPHEHPTWEITINNNTRKIEPTLLEGRASLYADECQISIDPEEIFSSMNMVLASEDRNYLKASIKEDDVRFFNVKDKHVVPSDGYITKDVSFAFVRNGTCIETIGRSVNKQEYDKNMNIYSLDLEEGNIIIMPDKKAVSVGVQLSDGLVDTKQVTGVAIISESKSVNVVKYVDNLFFKSSKEKMNGTFIKITNDGKTIQKRIAELNYREFKLNNHVIDDFGYLVNVSAYVKYDGVYDIELNIPGYQIRKYSFCYIREFDYQFVGAPYLFKDSATIRIPKTIKLVNSHDWEEFGNYHQLTFNFSETTEMEINDYVSDGQLTIPMQIGGYKVTAQFDIPVLYWKYKVKESWNHLAPNVISTKDLPDKIFIKGYLPIELIRLFINDIDGDESDCAPLYDKNNDCYYFRTVDFVEYLGKEQDYRLLGIEICNQKYSFLKVACRSIVSNANISGDFKNNVIYGDFDIFGSSDYSVTIYYNNQLVEEDVPVIDGHFELSMAVEEGKYQVVLFEIEEDDSGFGSDSYELRRYSLLLKDVEELEGKYLLLDDISFRNKKYYPLELKDGYVIQGLKKLDYDDDLSEKIDVYSWLYDASDESIMRNFVYYKGTLNIRTYYGNLKPLFDVLVIFDNPKDINQVLLFVLENDEALEPIYHKEKHILLSDDSTLTKWDRRRVATVLYDETYIVNIIIKE